MNRKIIYGIIIASLIGLIVLFILSKSKKKKEVAQIRNAISSGMGSSGQTISMLLSRVTPDSSYDTSTDIKTIKEAKGFFNDDEEAIYNTFSEKTKKQLKAIENEFQNKYGDSLDDFLKNMLSVEEYEKVLNQIKTSR